MRYRSLAILLALQSLGLVSLASARPEMTRPR